MSDILYEDTDKVLRYLLTLQRDTKNVVTIGTMRYSAINGITPEQFLRCLSELEPEYVSLYFAGPPTTHTLCYATLNRKALEYTARQQDEIKEGVWSNIRQWIFRPIFWVVGIIIAAIIEHIIASL